MSHDLEKTQSRLQNIRVVTPILGALRTISLSGWQMALNRRKTLAEYRQRLFALIPPVALRLTSARGRRMQSASTSPSSGRGVLLLVGSERGLCGRYNKILLEHVQRYLERQADLPETIEWYVLGKRLLRGVERAGVRPVWSMPLSITSLPSFGLATDLTREWLTRFEEGALDCVYVAYNADRGGGRYAPEIEQLLPPRVSGDLVGDDPYQVERWAEVIVETDPVALFDRLISHGTAVHLYDLLLEAASTEHAARFQLMESATQNAERIIEELTLQVQSARQQAITLEMQELASGAGLVGEGEEP